MQYTIFYSAVLLDAFHDDGKIDITVLKSFLPKDGILVKLARLRAKQKLATSLYLRFADDAAFVSYSEVGPQPLMNRFDAVMRLCLWSLATKKSLQCTNWCELVYLREIPP